MFNMAELTFPLFLIWAEPTEIFPLFGGSVLRFYCNVNLFLTVFCYIECEAVIQSSREDEAYRLHQISSQNAQIV